MAEILAFFVVLSFLVMASKEEAEMSDRNKETELF